MIRKARVAMQTQAAEDQGWLGRALVFIFFFVVAAGAGPQDFLASAGESQRDSVQVVGRWQRTDGNYVLELRNPAFDGGLTAAYFNPRPVNVSRSEWVLEGGNLMVLVELRDQGYPGSTYMLAYRQDSDRLVGIYYQAATQQRFEVIFQRIE